MADTIQDLSEGAYVQATVSHVTDEGTGIVGRSGKLHVPDCGTAGKTVTLRIIAEEDGYVVGEPTRPDESTDELYVQRASDASSPESDQLERVSIDEWRRRRLAARIHALLPGPIAARYPPESLTAANARSVVSSFAWVAVLGVAVYALYLAATAGLAAVGDAVAFAGRRPDVAFVLVALAVVGLCNLLFGYAMFELYVKVAGALAGVAVGVTVGTALAPGFAGAAAGTPGPAFVQFQNAILFGMLPVMVGATIGGTLGAALAPVLHRLSVVAGGSPRSPRPSSSSAPVARSRPHWRLAPPNSRSPSPRSSSVPPSSPASSARCSPGFSTLSWSSSSRRLSVRPSSPSPSPSRRPSRPGTVRRRSSWPSARSGRWPFRSSASCSSGWAFRPSSSASHSPRPTTAAPRGAAPVTARTGSHPTSDGVDRCVQQPPRDRLRRCSGCLVPVPIATRPRPPHGLPGRGDPRRRTAPVERSGGSGEELPSRRATSGRDTTVAA
ncbi:hypothetical protein VB773_00160 [Haloarculaceae archaeon H-GB2-1]|nr:hypothetical protein [Haloarculaceae archaeon H-GB2-1]